MGTFLRHSVCQRIRELQTFKNSPVFWAARCCCYRQSNDEAVLDDVGGLLARCVDRRPD